MAKKFPKTLYVSRRDAGRNDEYLACDVNLSNLAEVNDVVPAGIYQLVEVGEIDGTPTYRKTRK